MFVNYKSWSSNTTDFITLSSVKKKIIDKNIEKISHTIFVIHIINKYNIRCYVLLK